MLKIKIATLACLLISVNSYAVGKLVNDLEKSQKCHPEKGQTLCEFDLDGLKFTTTSGPDGGFFNIYEINFPKIYITASRDKCLSVKRNSGQEGAWIATDGSVLSNKQNKKCSE